MNSYKLFNIVEFIMTKCITMSDSVEWVSEHKKPKDLDRAKNMDEIVLQTLAFVKFIIVPHKFQNLSKLMNEIVNKVFLKWMVTERQKREKTKECSVENSTTLEKQPVLAPDQNSREINVESFSRLSNSTDK